MLIAVAVLLAISIAPVEAADSEYEPIGDELFDRTAQWALEQHRKHAGNHFAISLRFLLQHKYEVPSVDVFVDELLEWEGEFGSDLRYWQLLLRSDNLQEAIAGFPYSSTVELLSNQEFADLLENSKAGVDAYACLAQRRWAFIGDEHALQLADKAIALDPENAYFHYAKADILQTLGELEAAWEEVRLGNAAKHNYEPKPFPLSAVLEHREQFVTDDSRTAAAMLWTDMEKVHSAIAIKEKYKEVSLACALGMSLELADDYLVRAKRMGQQDNQDLMGQLPAMWSAISLLRYLPECCLSLDPEQQAECDAIETQLLEITANVLALSAKRQAPNCSGSPPGIPLSFMNEPSPDKWSDILLEIQCAEENKPLFDILEPPPFAIWARGELVGIDTGESINADGSTQEVPSD